jgi:hypothetical protein
VTALVAVTAWVSAVALGSVAVESEARLEAHGGETRVAGNEPDRWGELVVTPRVALLANDALDLAVAYAPRLTLPYGAPGGANDPTHTSASFDRWLVLHRVEASLAGEPTPRLSLRLGADAAYGSLDLVRSDVYAGDALPILGRIPWLSATARLEATATPTRRTRLSAAAEAGESGGADATAREVIPLERRARIETALRHDASRRDELALLADAAYSRFTAPAGVAAVEDAAIARLGGEWRRQLAPTVALRSGAGAAWTYSGFATGAVRDVSPYAAATLSHASPRQTLTTEVGVFATPYVSPFGSVDQRLGAVAAATWRAGRDVTVGARAAAGWIRTGVSSGAFWTGEPAATVITADARVAWAFARRGELSFGVDGHDQRSQTEDPSYVQWGATAELVFGTRWPR